MWVCHMSTYIQGAAYEMQVDMQRCVTYIWGVSQRGVCTHTHTHTWCMVKYPIQEEIAQNSLSLLGSCLQTK